MNYEGGYVVNEDGTITKGGKLLSTYDYGKSDNGQGEAYLGVSINRKTKLLHRIIAECHVPNPDPEKFKQVDHIDKNKRNNHASNLRWVSHGQNRCNSIRNRIRVNKAQYKGVYKKGNKWRVQIRKDGKNAYISAPFKTEREGAIHYNEVIHTYHPNAPLNEIKYDD